MSFWKKSTFALLAVSVSATCLFAQDALVGIIENGDLTLPVNATNKQGWGWEDTKVGMTWDDTRGHSAKGCIIMKGKTTTATAASRIFLPGNGKFDPSILFGSGVTKLNYTFYAKSGKTETDVLRKSTLHVMYQLGQSWPLEYKDKNVGGWPKFWAAGLIDTIWTPVTMDPDIDIIAGWTDGAGVEYLANSFQIYAEVKDITSIVLMDDFVLTDASTGTPIKTIYKNYFEKLKVSNAGVNFSKASSYNFSLLSANGKTVLSKQGFGTAVNFLNQGVPAGQYIVKGNSDMGKFVGNVLVK